MANTLNLLKESNANLQEDIRILNAKKSSLKLAQEVGNFGSWEIDLETHKSIWSEQSYRIYKLDPKTTSPTLETFTSRVIDEDKSKLANAMSKLVDGKIHSVSIRVKRADNIIIPIILNGKYIFNDEGKAIKLIGTTLDISKQVELQKENEELASIITHSNNEIFIIERETYKFLYINNKALENLGYTLGEIQQMNIFDIKKSYSVEDAKEVAETLMQDGTVSRQFIHVRKDGSTYHVQSYLQKRMYQGKEAAIVFNIDITDFIESEKKQKQQASILEQIQDSVITTNLDDIITHWNQGATHMHGYTQEEMIGKNINILYPKSEKTKISRMKKKILQNGKSANEVIKITKHKELICTETIAYILKDDKNNPIGIARYSRDITGRQETENKLKIQTEKLNFQAYHDALTRLPNKSLFEDRLEQAIINAKLHQEKIALFFLDLDNFKQINDTLGHQYGDKVLKISARRFKACLAITDTVARIGGDEFIFIVQHLENDFDATIMAKKLLKSLQHDFKIENKTLHVSASIGISLYPKDSENKNELLKYADTAMYKAKEEGRNSYQFYSSYMTQMAFEKSILEANLHKALDKKQFHVYYQPQIDSRSNTVTGLEALIRWHHPDMGIIHPNKFIALAEEIHLIQEIDNFVMYQAMKEMAVWHESDITKAKLSLNLSIRQLQNPHFLDIVCDNISKSGFDPHYLEFEITETQMMSNPQKSIEILQQLNKKGIHISIDDFGTGYSSLAYLKRLPVSKLKIDRSFIEHVHHNTEDASITQAIIVLAKSLKLNIIAEGVECKEQVHYLSKLGCHFIQGYYYSKALSQKDMTQYLQNHNVTKKGER